MCVCACVCVTAWISATATITRPFCAPSRRLHALSTQEEEDDGAGWRDGELSVELGRQSAGGRENELRRLTDVAGSPEGRLGGRSGDLEALEEELVDYEGEIRDCERGEWGGGGQGDGGWDQGGNNPFHDDYEGDYDGGDGVGGAGGIDGEVGGDGDGDDGGGTLPTIIAG